MRSSSLAVRAVALHLGTRLLVVAAVVVAAAVHPLGTGSLGGDVGAALGKSDGVWYLGIAHHGYGPPPPIGPDGVYTHLTSLAFFPLYPLLVRAVAFTGLPYLGAALLVTAIAGAVAAAAMAVWASRYLGARGALVLVAVWELLPSNVVTAMAYSEALFVAAAAGCLLALQRRRWLSAGAAAAVGGLTRPTGGALVLAVAVAAFLALRRAHGAQAAWRPVAAVVVAAAGLVASLWHVAAVTGRVDGWFWLERTVWNSGFDGGWSTLQHVGQLLTGGRTAHRLPEVVAVAAVAGVVALAAAAWWRGPRPDPPATAYAGAAATLAVGERGYFYVKPRLLLVAFPLLLPLAARLSRLPVRRLVLLGAVALLLSLGYDAYLLVGWPRAL